MSHFSAVDDSVSANVLPPTSASTQFDQIVFKLLNPLTQSDWTIPENVLLTVERLLAIIEHLQSPAGGWPSEIALTPQNLFPYLTEEAQDALDSFSQLRQSFTAENPSASEQATLLTATEIADWVLWAIARSACDTMQLLEGITAQSTEDGNSWQLGVLRLVPVLQVTSTTDVIAIDLTARRLYSPDPNSSLTAAATIQAERYKIGQQTIELHALRQSLVQSLQMTTSPLRSMLFGLGAEVLIPGQQWQEGLIQLTLEFEFCRDRHTTPTNSSEKPVLELDFTVSSNQHLLPPAIDRPLVRFTNEEWLQRYGRLIAKQHLADLLPNWRSLQSSPQAEEQAIALVVQEACDTHDLLSDSLTLASRNFPRQTWGLSALGLRLLWCISRGATDVMALLGGIRGQMLQPNSFWQSGQLRLLVSLTLQTSVETWRVDLATGQPLAANWQPLNGEAIVCCGGSSHFPHLQQVNAFQQAILERVKNATPEVELLFAGTEVELNSHNGTWQPGVIRLEADLDFVAFPAFTTRN